ncbi:MAG: hypothetical protein JWN76_123 [Chitinophagaceae bacterium]|nr:hypothetical protein [Chitinophagaceae bacterium]
MGNLSFAELILVLIIIGLPAMALINFCRKIITKLIKKLD